MITQQFHVLGENVFIVIKGNTKIIFECSCYVHWWINYVRIVTWLKTTTTRTFSYKTFFYCNTHVKFSTEVNYVHVYCTCMYMYLCVLKNINIYMWTFICMVNDSSYWSSHKPMAFLYINIVNEIYCHFTLVNDLQGNNDYFVFQQHLLFISVKSYIFSHFAETEYIFFLY